MELQTDPSHTDTNHDLEAAALKIVVAFTASLLPEVQGEPSLVLPDLIGRQSWAAGRIKLSTWLLRSLVDIFAHRL